jgi:hypothetical protein
MLKAPNPKLSKKKVDTIVRLSNSRGFGGSKIYNTLRDLTCYLQNLGDSQQRSHLGSQSSSIWVCVSSIIFTLSLPILPLGIIEFRECTMIDCPESLHSGADLIVSLSAYICGSAFRPPTTSSEDTRKVIFDDGRETLDEQTLRERKSSLLRLFYAVGLKPQSGNDFSKRRNGIDVELKEDAMKKMKQNNAEKSGKSVKTEFVGDGEEVEVEDEEDLSENELVMIYKKWAGGIFIIKRISDWSGLGRR